jgi:hypothetical protein
MTERDDGAPVSQQHPPSPDGARLEQIEQNRHAIREQTEFAQHAALLVNCEACGGLVNVNLRGYYKSPDDRFWHAICHDAGPPDGSITDTAAAWPTLTSTTRQYNCGHVGYGPLVTLPVECPECDAHAV